GGVVLIGARLYVSRATVKFHCGQIFAKLGVQSRSQAVALAYTHNLVPRLIAEAEALAQPYQTHSEAHAWSA
ncbi:MAG: helix-turn-helix transcriptional regulator, partial [Chloroflexaceae bacterium]